MGKLNVAIADDNERMLDLLGELIDRDKELTLVGKANNGRICANYRTKTAGCRPFGSDHAEMDGLSVMEQINTDKKSKSIRVLSL